MLILVILAVWFVISIIAAILFMVLVNRGRGQCAFHGFNRRLAIDTGVWEYFECPVCGARKEIPDEHSRKREKKQKKKH